jgi:hypothetical protein
MDILVFLVGQRPSRAESHQLAVQYVAQNGRKAHTSDFMVK